ncbi:MAG: apolipoprotein N-acyltransferase [Myxococcales bacterium]|nr:apolipoprotein N-acyltransferase [Myxococcales bacterium]HIK86728.1 apolipoprotein N-acyltransferase [Myxococcales bacterium]
MTATEPFAPETHVRALVLYAVLTLLSFPQELPGDIVFDLGLWAAWFGPAALIVGISGQRPGRAMRLAFFASLASHVMLFYWFYVVTVEYGHMPAALGFLAPLVPALYVSVFTALFAWLFARVATGYRFEIVVGAIAWVAVDWARGHFLGGFPWATLGYALHLDWPLLGWTRWGGVYALSFFAAVVGISLARAWQDRTRSTLRNLALTLGAIGIAHGVGFWISNTSPGSAVTIRIAAIQGNIDQGQKWDQAHRDQIFDSYLNLSRQATGLGAQWIVWPETALPGFLEAEPEYLSGISELARDENVTFIVGGTGVDFDPVARRVSDFYDSAFVIDSAGRIGHRYDKTHLVPFGEFVPLRDLFGRFFKSLARGLSNTDITPGGEPRALAIEVPGSGTEMDGLMVGVPICYELIFPDLVRRFADRGAGVLLAITNDAWYGRTGAPHQFLAMTALRSAETGRWTVRAANTGISAVIDAQGRIRESTRLFEEALIVADVPVTIDAPPTLYSRVGDVFAGFCVAVTMVLLGCRVIGDRAKPSM